MKQLNSKRSLHGEKNVLACDKCGEHIFFKNLHRQFLKERKEKENEFIDEHKSCRGKRCINCKQWCTSIRDFNNHIEYCNYMFDLSAQKEFIFPVSDFQFEQPNALKKILNRKKGQKNRQNTKKLCFECGRFHQNDIDDCQKLRCLNCNHDMNLFMFRKSLNIVSYGFLIFKSKKYNSNLSCVSDHIHFCRNFNTNETFFYEILDENSKNIQTNDILRLFDGIQFSISSTESSTESQLSNSKCKTTQKTKKDADSPAKLSSESSLEYPAAKQQCLRQSPTTSPSEANQHTQNISFGSSMIDEQGFYFAVPEPISSEDTQMASDYQPSTTEAGTSDAFDWTAYRNSKKNYSLYVERLQTLIRQFPASKKGAILLDNGLIDSSIIRANLEKYSPNEFFRKQLHMVLMDQSWNTIELHKYMALWNTSRGGSQEKYFKDIFTTASISQLNNRKSKSQFYKTSLIEDILDFLMSNSTFLSDVSRDFVKKKVSKVKNSIYLDFYR